MNQLFQIVKDIIRPREFIEDICTIDILALKEKGIGLLLIDVDNTILPAAVDMPSIRAVHWFQDVKKYGLKVVLTSNSLNKKRLTKIAKDLGVQAYYFVGKPFTFIVKKIVEQNGFTLKETALIGDEIINDIMLGNWLDLYTILVKNCDHPVSTKNEPGILHRARGVLFEKMIDRQL